MATGTLDKVLITAAILIGSSNCIAETVRQLEKPSIQIQSLTPESGWACTINIQGPPDTQFESTGKSMFVTKGKNNVFTALLTRKEFSQTELLIKSNFTRETIKLGFSSHLFPISLTSFVINNCEVGIEKLENGNLTQYKARLRNCEYQKAHERYFMFDLRYNSGDNVQMYSLDKNEPAFKRYSQYSKYATTYYGSEEKDVYYAILNFQALIADDITVENFRFLSVYDKNLYGDSDLSSHHWIYNL